MNIKIKNLHLAYGSRVLIEEFSISVSRGERIAIMGKNGSGKSTLMKYINEHYNCAYVPQFLDLDGSGGEKFMRSFNDAQKLLRCEDEIALLLDEPTNHLDAHNRRHLFRILQRYEGTLICISHDLELLEMFNNFWHIENSNVNVFRGNYSDYMKEREKKSKQLKSDRESLQQEKEKISLLYKKVQERSQGSNAQRLAKKAHLQRIIDKKDKVIKQINDMPNLEETALKFWIKPQNIKYATPIKIRNGSLLRSKKEILRNINLNISYDDRVLIKGANGSGKTTLLKGIMSDPSVQRAGEWKILCSDIGYFDQHYSNLDPEETIFNAISDMVVWSLTEIRRYLSQFLFKTGEEMSKKVKDLSGGEKARLSLAKIAIKSPSILILDEVTNNIDLQTKEHIIKVLNEYKNTIIIISHDAHFVQQVKADVHVEIKGGEVRQVG